MSVLYHALGRLKAIAGAALCFALVSGSHATELRVEVGASRSRDAVYAATDQAVRDFAKRMAFLGSRALEKRYATGRLRTPYTIPLRVVLTKNGVALPMNRSVLTPGTDLVPTFDASGPRSFPALYQTLLEDAFTLARPVMNAVYGSPKVGGVVRVRNYDADIEDRYAVGGGYYIPNGPDGPEIRFPVYFSDVSASINYVHTLLLAYHGDAPIAIDAVSEGLVRAATMRVVRTPNTVPNNPGASVIEATLDSLYDVSAHYDWYNQPALGAERFIAPNLLATTLPIGGSTGGIFLIRYMMAGTAWAKVLTEYPGFAAEFNSRYYASTGSYVRMADFAALGQDVIDFLAGAPGAEVEGLSFSDWVERQFIFETETSAGLKIMVQPFPVAAQGGTSDFGVFGLDVNVFRTLANGDESLLAGTSYPVYWRPDFVRMFASAQDDEIKIAGAYGSVVPNFPFSEFGGQQYRVTVDVPFSGVVSRVVLPAGSYSTGSSPSTKNFYGTLLGLPPLTSGTYEVTIEWIGGSHGPITAQNFAFGASIADSAFEASQPCLVRVVKNDILGTTELYARRVNKGFGPLALELKHPDSFTSYSAVIPARLSLAGVPLQPFRGRPTSLLGTSDEQTLFAQWNPLTAKYDLFPDAGQILGGVGFYWRPPTATGVSVDGLAVPHTPVSVSLSPGWNVFSVPFNETIDTTDVRFTVASESVATYAQSVGSTIGNTIFEYVPDAVNPDLGTLVPATTFSPGKGYFVRALRPEGAVMVLDPTTFSPTLPGSFAVTTSEKRWEATVRFEDTFGMKTQAVIGQSSVTTRGFDPVRDSELPPSPGGFQVAIHSARSMYKEIEPLRDRPRFNLTLSGLRIGQTYRASLSASSGVKSVKLYCKEIGSRLMVNCGEFTFIAKRATQTFEVNAEVRL